MALLFLAGCQPTQPIVPESLLPEKLTNEEPLPTYNELIRRYNATTEPLVRVWAEARVDLVWLDEKGKRKSEHGDGRFMYVAPDKVALEVREVGRGFWAGRDEQRYWLFDLQDERIAYVGRYENLDKLDEDALPFPVKPTDLPYVLGLLPIDPDVVPDGLAVELVAGHYLIEPPGLGLRMLLHPETARPVRVDIVNKKGESAVKCLLYEPTQLKPGTDAVEGPAPIMPSRAEVYVLGQEARMTLRLKGLTTEGRAIRDTHFDFDKLKQALKIPDPQNVVDLDTPARPAP
jgi:hypothetical protein